MGQFLHFSLGAKTRFPLKSENPFVLCVLWISSVQRILNGHWHTGDRGQCGLKGPSSGET